MHTCAKGSHVATGVCLCTPSFLTAIGKASHLSHCRSVMQHTMLASHARASSCFTSSRSSVTCTATADRCMPRIDLYLCARASHPRPPVYVHQAVCASGSASHSSRVCLQGPSAVRKAPSQASSSLVQSLTAASQRPSGPLLEPLEAQLCSMAAGASRPHSLLQCKVWTHTCSRRWLPAQSCLQSSSACSSERW